MFIIYTVLVTYETLPVDDEHADDEGWDFHNATDPKVQKLVPMKLWCSKENPKVAYTVCCPATPQNTTQYNTIWSSLS